MLIDSHAHLELEDFDEDREQVIERARQAGVEVIVSVGINLADSHRAVEIAEKYEPVYAAVGIHPHDVKEIGPETYDVLGELARREKVVAYGEIGLDFFRGHAPREMQIRRFGEQLEVAQSLDLPVIIHDRMAHRETMAMLKGWKGRKRGIVHCFSGDYAMASQCIDLGFYISIPATVTYPKALEIRDVVRRVPLNALLVETDAPFLPPQSLRGKRNEPAYVARAAEKIAEIKGISTAEVASGTSRNARAVFALH
ncbi:MAG TPA: TatD family hydrolase [Syntrophales bacterium]|jgi:TatD DNase family protein|nr:TatD family hydrolase [Syntrophales bacterium]HQA82169.1 TatD family hydrolase [Syntrophales bacterium]